MRIAAHTSTSAGASISWARRGMLAALVLLCFNFLLGAGAPSVPEQKAAAAASFAALLHNYEKALADRAELAGYQEAAREYLALHDIHLKRRGKEFLAFVDIRLIAILPRVKKIYAKHGLAKLEVTSIYRKRNKKSRHGSYRTKALDIGTKKAGRNISRARQIKLALEISLTLKKFNVISEHYSRQSNNHIHIAISGNQRQRFFIYVNDRRRDAYISQKRLLGLLNEIINGLE